MRGYRGVWQVTCTVLTLLALVGAAQAAEPTEAAVRVDAGKVLREMDPRMLGSTNVALWNGKDCLTSPVANQWLREMGPKLIRLPAAPTPITYTGTATACAVRMGRSIPRA